MLQSHLPLWSALAVASGLAWGLMALGALLAPRGPADKPRPGPARATPVGAVFAPGGAPGVAYGIVVLFVVGTVAASMLYPWAAVFRNTTEGRGSLSPLVALLDMGVLGTMLLVAVVYAWRRGALAWYAGVQPPQPTRLPSAPGVPFDAAVSDGEDDA